jgi:hypothetical protein
VGAEEKYSFFHGLNLLAIFALADIVREIFLGTAIVSVAAL